jgi:hypothetical protein
MAAIGAAREGYFRPGYEMGRHLSGFDPDSFDEAGWEAAIAQLVEFVEFDQDDKDDANAIEMLVEWFPHMMALVPKRRDRTFMAGVRQFVADFGVES